MWVEITSVQSVLDSDPADIPNFPKGSVVRLLRSHVIDVIFTDPDTVPAASTRSQREYWERCFVDQCVLDRELSVGYIYREEPDMIKDGDRFPDSGWCIRGDTRGKSTEELAAREIAYVALGAVLNKDDTWLHLIDVPIGASFEKDFETGVFVRVA